jgi:hypothetical protein
VKTALKLVTRTALAAMLALALPSAHADRGRDDAGQANRRDAKQPSRQQSAQAQRSLESRGQRMSAEEKRQLRRDIKDAGKEIYPPRR